MAARSGPKPQKLDDNGVYKFYIDFGNPRSHDANGKPSGTKWGSSSTAYSTWFSNVRMGNANIVSSQFGSSSVKNLFSKEYGGVLNFGGASHQWISMRQSKTGDVSGSGGSGWMLNEAAYQKYSNDAFSAYNKWSFEIWFRCNLSSGSPSGVRPQTLIDWGGNTGSTSTLYRRYPILGIRNSGKLGFMLLRNSGHSWPYNNEPYDDGEYDSVPSVIEDADGTSGMPTFGVGDTGWQYLCIYQDYQSSGFKYYVSVNGVLLGSGPGKIMSSAWSSFRLSSNDSTYLGVARDRTTNTTSERVNFMNGQVAMVRTANYPQSGTVGFSSETAAHNYDAMKGRFGL
tara:strand:- start:86 stop:1108 length:1023 start_codon:yes stop_codon:yes gene_type:complete